jgi:hypothetical protein
MARKAIRRKANTALVFNPSRGLSIGSRSTGRTSAVRAKNPTARKAAAVANPRRRKSRRRRNNPGIFGRRLSNPSSASSLLAAAVMAGIGVTLFDLVAGRVVPAHSTPLVKAGIKLGAALGFQSLGQKIPVIGRYKDDIALVLAVLGAVDLLRIYALPPVSDAVANFTNGALRLIPAPPAQTQPAAGDTTMSGYGPYVYA